MTVPVVEKNIPLPLKFPFDKMEVGDSFAIPSEVKRATVAVYARRYGDKHGMKFITRQMPDGSIRCWRTK
jgi:hypothetical protein